MKKLIRGFDVSAKSIVSIVMKIVWIQVWRKISVWEVIVSFLIVFIFFFFVICKLFYVSFTIKELLDEMCFQAIYVVRNYNNVGWTQVH